MDTSAFLRCCGKEMAEWTGRCGRQVRHSTQNQHFCRAFAAVAAVAVVLSVRVGQSVRSLVLFDGRRFTERSCAALDSQKCCGKGGKNSETKSWALQT